MPLATQWQLFPTQQTTVHQLSQCLNLNPIIAQILLNRQLSSLSQVESFLGHSKQSNTVQLTDDSLRQSWALILQAIADKTRILIYGDYDVDGMTSTAMMVACLRLLGADVSYYIPDRFKEGYGLNMNCVNLMQKESIGLLITLDCGVTSVAEITAIKSETKAKVIVIDHHTLPDQLPPFDVMVNPKELSDSHYLYGLCTAGIIYYWIRYGKQQGTITTELDWFLCLAAIGTVADVAPLIGGNRDLVRDGLIAISKGHHLGIQTLLETAQFNSASVTSRDIGFVIAPRLNASGRLASAKIGVQLLLASSKSNATQIARQLEQLNHERRTIDQAMRNEAMALAAPIKDNVIALYDPKWHPGVIGITASKLVDQFSKPAVLMTKENGIIRGSCRSAGRVNIYELLKTCQHLFQSFGGHKEAAGFSLTEENFNAFYTQLVQTANTTITPQQLLHTIPIDAHLTHDQITMDLAQDLALLMPFGHHNEPPIFYSKTLHPVDFKLVGQGRHLKVTFKSECGKKVFDGIGFGMSDAFLPLIQQNKPVCVAYHLTINEWNNEKNIQLQLLDIKRL